MFARSHGYEVLDLCLIEDYWPTAGSQAPGVPLPVAATVREVAGAEGEVDVDPMAYMCAPRVTEEPVPILTPDDLKALLSPCMVAPC